MQDSSEVSSMYYSEVLKHLEDTPYGPTEFEDRIFHCKLCYESYWEEDDMHEHCKDHLEENP